MLALMMAEGITTALYLLSLIISLTTAAILLSQSPPDAITEDDRSNITYATRGAYIPLIVGRDLISPIVMWVQSDSPSVDGFQTGSGGVDNSPTQGKGSGGGGGPGNFQEWALHALCVGPGSALHRIKENGKTIWEGPLTPASHPSGTAVNIPGHGTFVVYWGFRDDPRVDGIHNTSTSAGIAENHGIETRYPLIMKILWQDYNLGPVRQWPRLQYEVETQCRSKLANTSPRIPETYDEARPLWQDWIDEGLPPSFIQPPQTAQDRIVLEILGFDVAPDPNLFPGPSTKILIIGDPNSVVPGGSTPPQQRNYTAHIAVNSATKLFGNQGTLVRASNNLQNFLAPAAVDPTGEYVYVKEARWESRRLVAEFQSPGVYSGWRPYDEMVFFPNANDQTIQGATILYMGGKVVNRRIENVTPQVASQYPKCQFLETSVAAGYNPAHVIDQLAFAKYPYGAALNRSKFDIDTLEEAAFVLVFRENYFCSVIADNGETAQSLLTRLLQDIGMMIVWDPTTGLYNFKLIRHPGYFGQVTLAEITAGMSMSEPQIDNSQGPQAIDKMLFTIRDRERNYRENPIVINDHGQAVRQEVQQARKIPISTTNYWETAVEVARRRAQEASANQNVIQLELTHQARLMACGLPFTAPGVINDNITLRCMTVQRSTKSNKVKITAMVDSYDPPLPDEYLSGSALYRSLVKNQGGLITLESGSDGQTEPAFSVQEVPRYLSDGEIRLFIPFIRDSQTIQGVRLWFSRDGNSYTGGRVQSFFVAGGSLKSSLASTTDRMLEDVVSLYSISPDADLQKVESLVGLDESFKLGRQLVLIGDELMYLRKLAPAPDTASEWEMTGLMRGRYGTTPKTHAAGSHVFIFFAHDFVTQKDLLFRADKEIFVKSQVVGYRRAQSLADAPQKQITLAGKAIRPMDLGSIWISGQRQQHDDAEDVVLNWTYRTPKPGAGMQGYGDPYIKDKNINFRVTISDPAGSIDDIEVVTSDSSYTFTSASRSAAGYSDAGGDQWDITVRAVEDGYESTPITKRYSAS